MQISQKTGNVVDIWEDGEVALKGSRGTVVGIIKDGVAYHVEFFEPMHMVVSAARNELKERR